jgi:hypothetical protein
MSFSEVDTADKKYDKGSFQVIEVIANVPKNRTSTVRIAKVKYRSQNFIQLQVWKNKEGTEQKFAAKGQNIIIKPEVAQKLGEILIKL